MSDELNVDLKSKRNKSKKPDVLTSLEELNAQIDGEYQKATLSMSLTTGVQMKAEINSANALSVYKIYPSAELPVYATKGSGWFDLKAYLGTEVQTVKGYSSVNLSMSTNVQTGRDGVRFCILAPGDRILIPTGLIFDIPVNHEVQILPRSSTGLKKGLEFPHSQGIVDSDYVEECFIVLKNASATKIKLCHGERLAQACLVQSNQVSIVETTTRPSHKTTRVSGFGHTGDY